MINGVILEVLCVSIWPVTAHLVYSTLIYLDILFCVYVCVFMLSYLCIQHLSDC